MLSLVELSPVEYGEPPMASLYFCDSRPATCGEGMKEIPADACYRGGSGPGSQATGTAVAIRPNTDTFWMETGMNHSSGFHW